MGRDIKKGNNDQLYIYLRITYICKATAYPSYFLSFIGEIRRGILLSK